MNITSFCLTLVSFTFLPSAVFVIIFELFSLVDSCSIAIRLLFAYHVLFFFCVDCGKRRLGGASSSKRLCRSGPLPGTDEEHPHLPRLQQDSHHFRPVHDSLPSTSRPKDAQNQSRHVVPRPLPITSEDVRDSAKDGYRQGFGGSCGEGMMYNELCIAFVLFLLRGSPSI